MDGLEEGRKSPLIDGVQSEGLFPMHVHAENSGNITINEAAAVGPSFSGLKVNNHPASVGPSVFSSGNGPSSIGPDLVDGSLKSRARRKPSLGPKQRKGKAQLGKSCSPGDHRPLKRSRRVVEEQEEGFGFIGFTSNSSCVPESGRPDEGRDLDDIDLNVDVNQVPLVNAGMVNCEASSSPVGMAEQKDRVCHVEVNKEVDNTVNIGEAIGLNLHSFTGMIKDSIVNSGIKVFPQ
ncbi:hypothetical protein Hanom_Chr02g00130201 [Helianthus anomalus]